jgi:hypothetical protein
MNTGKSLVALSIVMLCSVSFAGGTAETSWIAGTVSPPNWSINPAQPAETSVISFSGPVRVFLNRCVAEAEFGGRPTIVIDTVNKTVELKFVAPPSSDCSSPVDPVCGIQGHFGPLAAGQWGFFCTHDNAPFSLVFQVTAKGTGGKIYYVDASAIGANNGSSWTNAFVYLQDALAAAASGSEIRVAGGLYRPDQGSGFSLCDTSATFHLRSGITLKGGYAGRRNTNPDVRNTTLYETILNGDLGNNDNTTLHPYDQAARIRRGDNCFHVVTTSNADASASLDGFTISGGGNLDLDERDEDSRGGGIYSVAGRPTIQNCWIVYNASTSYGAGIYIAGNGSPTLLGCTFTRNWANWRGGAIYANSNSTMVIDRCFISGNEAAYQGGGIAVYDAGGELDISNSVISGNLAADKTSGQGGGFYLLQAKAQLNHCTVVGNVAATGSALAYDILGQSTGGRVSIRNSIIWNGYSPIFNNGASKLEIAYSTVQGGFSGTGNLTLDPRFVQNGYWQEGSTPDSFADDTWVDGNYRLAAGSPCIDAGDPLEIPSVGTLDLAGQSRLSGAAVDMGAYEYRNDSPIAKAGPIILGFSMDGRTGLVTLDASASYDPEGAALTYRWYRNDVLVSTAVKFTLELSLGDHLFTLVVNDGTSDSQPIQVTARIVTFTNTALYLTPNPFSRGGGNDPITAVLSLPSGKQPADFDQSEPVLFIPGNLKAKTQAAQIWMNGTPLVIATFDKASVLAAIPKNGSTEVRVVGRLKSGMYFSGTQTLTIK